MKILLLGGTGNLSAECAELLHRQGHEILVLTRGQSRVPAEYRALVADRRDPASMQSALNEVRPDVVINFIGFEVAEVQADFALFRDRVRQYLFVSSATVYSKPPQRLPITEEHPLGNPFWDYAAKKVACERWLGEAAASHGFPVTIIRPSHTYSHRWVPNPVSSASYTYAARLEQGKPVFVPDDGQNLWTLTAARDFAVGVAGLVGRKHALGEAFHITSDEVLTWNQIVHEIARAVGVTRPQIVPVPTEFIVRVVPELSGNLKGDKAHPAIFDNAKIKRFVPDFQCRTSFRTGVRESVEWLRAHPEAQNLNPEVDARCDRVIAAWRGVSPSL